jgi:hypothetical protein
VDVDGMVAWWLDAYLRGEMPGDSLTAALGELAGELPPRLAADEYPRLTALVSALQRALSGEADESTVQRTAEQFLGAPPAQVLRVRAMPAWHSDG